MSSDRPGGSKPLPPPFSGLVQDDERRAAVAEEYQRQLASIDLEQLDDAPPEPPPVASTTPPSYPAATTDTREPGRPNRPNLEPIPEQAHPAQNRRIPTQPPTALSLDLDSADPLPAGPTPATAPAKLAAPKPIIRQSPAPVRRGLFSIDRPTNLLAGAAVGLMLSVFPAKKMAESYETREVEPMLAELEESIEQTLAVEAGLVERPEAVAENIHDGRTRARRRFMMVWLLAGLSLGLGLGLAPRPGD